MSWTISYLFEAFLLTEKLWFFLCVATNVDREMPISDDAPSDNEFQDAEDLDGTILEEKFSDALDLDNAEPELTEQEMIANKDKSDAIKQNGNDVFKAGDYEKAIELYTEAIELCPKRYKNERSILFNNRAAAHKHMDAKSVAIDDCTKAIELNPEYVKALSRLVTIRPFHVNKIQFGMTFCIFKF